MVLHFFPWCRKNEQEKKTLRFFLAPGGRRAYDDSVLVSSRKTHIALHLTRGRKKEPCMSFHFLSHSWEVASVQDGLEVTLYQRDLDPDTLAVFVEELTELLREGGQPNLYLDLDNVRFLRSVFMAKLTVLDEQLRRMDCRLILCNLDPVIYETFQTTRLADSLDIRLKKETAAY
jgi:anti-anti-sigma factor